MSNNDNVSVSTLMDAFNHLANPRQAPNVPITSETKQIIRNCTVPPVGDDNATVVYSSDDNNPMATKEPIAPPARSVIDDEKKSAFSNEPRVEAARTSAPSLFSETIHQPERSTSPIPETRAPPTFMNSGRESPPPSMPPRVETIRNDDNATKQYYLSQLVKYKLQGLELTRDFTMADSLDEIRFEYESIQNTIDSVNGVNMLNKGYLAVVYGVEKVNSWLGDWLPLQGFGNFAASKETLLVVNYHLEKIYQRYFRQFMQNPIFALLFLLISMIIVYCFTNRAMQNTQSDTGPAGLLNMVMNMLPVNRSDLPIPNAPTEEVSGPGHRSSIPPPV